MEEQTQFRGASLFVVFAGLALCGFDWLFAMSAGPAQIVAPFGLFGFVTVVGGGIAFYRSRPAKDRSS